jgi:hypothetical protein
MLNALITSKTRIKLLLKFFLNSNNQDYLRKLETDLGDNTNAIRQELIRLEDAGLLKSFSKGNKKYFQSNVNHPLFADIHSIIMKITGLDELVKRVLNNIGSLEEVYLTGDLAKGNNSDVIELILIGEIKQDYIIETILKAQSYINKKINFTVYNPSEFQSNEKNIIMSQDLLIWKK